MRDSLTLKEFSQEEAALKKQLAYIEYLNSNSDSGSEQYDFWLRDDSGDFLRDENRKFIPDMKAAYEFGTKLREDHPDLNIKISTNIVRVSVK